MDSKATLHSLSPVSMLRLVLMATFETFVSDLFIGRIKHRKLLRFRQCCLFKSLSLVDKQAFSRGEISPCGTILSSVEQFTVSPASVTFSTRRGRMRAEGNYLG